MSTNLQRTGACRVLGPDHPLARVTSQLSTAVEQCLTVSLVLAVGVYALIDDLSIGAPLTVAAATVLAGLLARVGALVESRNRRAVDLIAEGRGSLPLEAVVRARRRLLDPAQRECLARTLDVIRAEVARPAGACHRMPSSTPSRWCGPFPRSWASWPDSCAKAAGCAAWPARNS